jgi:hypothetical protein
MAMFEVWTTADHGTSKPAHSLTADHFAISEHSIVFYSSDNTILHVIVPTPGIVIKKIMS